MELLSRKKVLETGEMAQCRWLAAPEEDVSSAVSITPAPAAGG